ncbi:hypothetical protein [Actinokineospora enzanensis]|uniref:hypothetical protein n=1 Tax=Actinokineospora enzanensis TaxID=155975 RepID=UPI0003674635|nr:hypothetical protein [Actinokineospora enzanensis]
MPDVAVRETIAHFGDREAIVTLVSGHVRYCHGLQITEYGTVRLLVDGGENDGCWLTEIADIQPAA